MAKAQRMQSTPVLTSPKAATCVYFWSRLYCYFTCRLYMRRTVPPPVHCAAAPPAPPAAQGYPTLLKHTEPSFWKS
eukprot:306844-Prorocentrum_minimum.AAC.1